MFAKIFSADNYVYFVEMLSILGIVGYLCYIFYSLNLFRKN